jgi:hypothetical protein
MRIPIGLCDVTYNGITHTALADEAIFEAKPKYSIVRKGQMEKIPLLEDYDVSLQLYLHEETYETMKLANPSLHDYNGGLFDDPTKVNLIGKQLTIHPAEAGDSKEYDITLFSAILDYEQSYKRVFRKGIDTISIRFLGQPSKQINGNKFKSYYFIGDVVGAGV